ncbi:SusE outer membrane protein [Reichenbachiella faecimaris]|uniref:SusE outer membrane protein n=1 Tax=Reichenbachiella faecimaris TaxID=692418 RepID=A0A1W2GL25_REIFA|nr:SusE domain-containing protein [Reichenbachiella faecimaris]SMD37271.1 SusE outer membrane protein [Reichenbachiella faecimaris]
MKNLSYIYLLATAVLFGACDEEAEKITISSDPVAPVLTSPGVGGLEFVLADRNETIEFTWEEVDFGFDASVTYAVELATDVTFENKSVALTAQGASGSALVDDVNVALLGLGLPFGSSATVHCRVTAAVNTAVDTVYSTVTDFTATPYETIYPIIYAPGAYQGWNPGGDIGRLYSYGFNSVYEGILRIVEGTNPSSSFKLTPEANWDNAWGGALTADGAKFVGTLDPSGGDFSIAAGTYKVTADVSALTIELEKTDDWGIIGDATPNGWSDPDTDMTYNGQRQVWEITTDLTDGFLKFRANDNWGVNYGDDEPDGTLDAGGGDIPVTAGNYTIRLDLVNEKYELIEN